MDASGLGAIVGASRRATAHGSSFQVVCDRRQIRRLFRLAGLEGQIRLARTLVEVLQALESDRQLNEMLVINGFLE
jgi:anti-anti-sigma factor